MLRAYIVYSAYLGPEEGALLCFAQSVREAKKISWGCHSCWISDEWLDHTARWLRDEHVFLLGNQKKLAAGIPHVIDNPPGCYSCNFWGYEVIEGGICSYCGEPVGDELVDLYRKQKLKISPVEWEREYLGEFHQR